MSFLKQYWSIILVFVIGISIGVITDKLYFEPNEPYLLLDTNMPVEGLPFKYMPVEMTGGNPLTALKVTRCKVPEQFVQYVHNRPQGEWNPMNPEGKLGKTITDWAWPVVFALLVATGIYAAYKYKKGELKIGKHKKNTPNG